MQVQLNENVEVTGHLMDSGILARILDDVLEYGGDYVIDRLDVGPRARRLVVREDLRLGRRRRHPAAAADAAADPRRQPGRPGRGDGARGRCRRRLPEDFYSTTNLETRVRMGGRWIDVQQPEMDCGLVVLDDGGIRTIPVSDVRRGDRSSAAHPGQGRAPAARADR
jgi:hypothetical protein